MKLILFLFCLSSITFGEIAEIPVSDYIWLDHGKCASIDQHAQIIEQFNKSDCLMTMWISDKHDKEVQRVFKVEESTCSGGQTVDDYGICRGKPSHAYGSLGR